MAEDIRMDAAKAVLNNYSDSDVDRFNAMVADYNSRCGSYRYRNGALEGARRDIEPYRGQLQTEGRSRFAHSPSTGSLSAPAPAPATGQWQQPQVQGTPSDADLEKQHWDFIHAKVPDANQLTADPRLLPWVNKSPMRQRYYEEGTAYEVVQLLTDFKLHLASLPQNAPVTAPVRPVAEETVRAVQQKLNELGYNAGQADGLMGRGTRAAIIAFQQDRGLATTGVADQALLLQLQQAPTRSSRPQAESRPTTTSVQLSAAESASLEAACSTDKYVNGPAAYRACVERQKAALAAGVRRPNLSVLSSAEQQSIEAACSTDKYVNGPAAYNECLANQLAAMSGQGARRPDLSRLSSPERQSIEAACSTDKYVNGPAAYNRCLNNQLAALERQGGRPDLSRLSTTERSSIEAACSTDKYVNGPAAYNRCLSQQLARLRN
ncbi:MULTISPECIES: peptidoglycan-binding domain-containing protein [Stutzerimonas stutzeri subgroup]|nr:MULTISPECIES: peptidoglycan-binding domain-containing protein [Stutzerimonas stutzeri subgroup]MCQ4256253.1 peptidoglycan-binding protein [Stutzerimonas stutzeri]